MLVHLGIEDGPGYKVDPAHYDVERKGVHNGHLWLHIVQARRWNPIIHSHTRYLVWLTAAQLVRA